MATSLTEEEKQAQQHLEQNIFKEGQEYAERNSRSRKENKGRAESRDRIKKLGIHTKAYQWGIALVKDFTANERKQILADMELVISVLGKAQQELFPEEALKAAAREKRTKDRLQKQEDEAAANGRTQEELDAETDKNPRSDPGTGGAAKTTKSSRKKQPTEAELTANAAAAAEANQQAEQTEGDEVLKEAAPKLSQSEIAAQRREKAFAPSTATH